MEMNEHNLSNLIFRPDKNYWISKTQNTKNRCRHIYTKYKCANCGREFLATQTSKKAYCTRKCYSDLKHKWHVAMHTIAVQETCSSCNQTLPISEFYLINKKLPSIGHSSVCKSCSVHKGIKWRSKDPIRTRCIYTLNRIKAKTKNCDIDFDWLYDKMSNGYCEITGIPFDFNYGRKRHPYSPSIDRIDASKGYLKNNCRMVVWIYNMAKGEWTEDQLDEFVLHYAEIINGRKKRQSNCR